MRFYEVACTPKGRKVIVTIVPYTRGAEVC